TVPRRCPSRGRARGPAPDPRLRGVRGAQVAEGVAPRSHPSRRGPALATAPRPIRRSPLMDPEPSWNWLPGRELAPGLLAWAPLGDGRRCETWLAWDLGRWCPVVVKVPRPGGATGRAVAALAQEAQVAGSVAHPGVRRLLEARLDQPVAQLVF